MESLEQLSFIVWVRESGSVWGYATFLFLHTLGLSTLAGISAGIDLRLLGMAPALPLQPMKRLFPIMWLALGITAISGIVLLMTDTSKATMPVFLIKLLLVATSVTILRLLYVRVFEHAAPGAVDVPPGARNLAAASLMLWVGATVAGRLMAYLTESGGF